MVNDKVRLRNKKSRWSFWAFIDIPFVEVDPRTERSGFKQRSRINRTSARRCQARRITVLLD